MSLATQGRAREYRVFRHMERHGWQLIMRSAASKGPADGLLAHWIHGAALVQVGAGSKRLNPADRGRLLHAAELCHAVPLLAVTLPGVGVRFWVVGAGSASTWEPWDVAAVKR